MNKNETFTWKLKYLTNVCCLQKTWTWDEMNSSRHSRDHKFSFFCFWFHWIKAMICFVQFLSAIHDKLIFGSALISYLLLNRIFSTCSPSWGDMTRRCPSRIWGFDDLILREVNYFFNWIDVGVSDNFQWWSSSSYLTDALLYENCHKFYDFQINNIGSEFHCKPNYFRLITSEEILLTDVAEQ